jgi:hypothetical protein
MWWAWLACSPDPLPPAEPADPLPIPDDDGRFGPEPEIAWTSTGLYLVGYCPLPGLVIADNIPGFVPTAISTIDGATLAGPTGGDAPFLQDFPGRRYGPAGEGCILGPEPFRPEQPAEPVRRYDAGQIGSSWTRVEEELLATGSSVVVTSFERDTLIGSDAIDGGELWRVVWPEPDGFTYATDDEIHRASGCAELGLAIVNGHRAIASEDLVAAVDLESGAVLWEQGGSNLGPTSWHCAAGQVLVSWDEQVYAYDMRTGEVIWRRPWAEFGSQGWNPSGDILALDARYALVCPQDMNVVSLIDATDGRLRWSFPGANGGGVGLYAASLYARGLLTETSAILHLEDEGIVSLDLADATVRWHRAYLGSPQGSENVALTYEGAILHTAQDAAGGYYTELIHDRPAD